MYHMEMDLGTESGLDYTPSFTCSLYKLIYCKLIYYETSILNKIIYLLSERASRIWWSTGRTWRSNHVGQPRELSELRTCPCTIKKKKTNQRTCYHVYCNCSIIRVIPTLISVISQISQVLLRREAPRD